MKIAVVGAGISGLTAAYLLSSKHQVTVFEAGNYAGGHTNTVSVSLGERTWRVDTGFIVYNERNYPHFTQLLNTLGVRTQPSSMSFSVRNDKTGLEYNGSTIRQLFVQKVNLFRPSFYRMIADILKFNRSAMNELHQTPYEITLGEYLRQNRYSNEFVEHYLVPMGAAIWSTIPDQVLEMPVHFFVRFFENHGMLTVNDRPEWRVISGGSSNYVDKLTETFKDRIRLNTAVKGVRRTSTGVEVDGEPFDHVIMACHSDQALAILHDPSPVEKEVLGALEYQKNEITLHTDTTLLPKSRSAWAAWNYYVGESNVPVQLTYNMNILQSLDAPETFCVSLNAAERIDPSKILGRFQYSHPVFSEPGVRAQNKHSSISGTSQTHFCGAYWGNGFHEDGVNSALVVARFFGESL